MRRYEFSTVRTRRNLERGQLSNAGASAIEVPAANAVEIMVAEHDEYLNKKP